MCSSRVQTWCTLVCNGRGVPSPDPLLTRTDPVSPSPRADVMDNHYVPNLTIGPMVCKALRSHGVTAPIDVHLMVSPVDRIIGDFADAGASYITFHPEATGHIDRSLQLVRSLGCKSGLVFNPATPLDCLEYVMDKVCRQAWDARRLSGTAW